MVVSCLESISHFILHYHGSLLAVLLTPGNASNVAENGADNAESTFPAEGMGGDDLGCYSDDDVGPANDCSPLLASHAKNTAIEVLHVLVIVLQTSGFYVVLCSIT